MVDILSWLLPQCVVLLLRRWKLMSPMTLEVKCSLCWIPYHITYNIITNWLCYSCFCFFSQPCQHGCSGHGDCRVTGSDLTDFHCTCNPPYFGKICDHYFAGCDPKSGEPNVCHNGGVCKSTVEPYSYKCECPPAFKGEQCDISVPEVRTSFFSYFYFNTTSCPAL